VKVNGQKKIRIKFKRPHQDIQDKGKDESSNPISHEDYHPILLEDGIFLAFHWAQEFSS
jgi:hypothetical protein